MKFWPLILLFGVGFAHWTTASQFIHGNCLVDIEEGTLISVNVTDNSTNVDLSGLDIETIKEHVFDDLTNVKSLNLSNNKFETLPSHIFSKLHSLEELSLANNKIDSILLRFEGLDSLKRLDIPYTKIRNFVPGDLLGLIKSTELLTEGSQLFSISPSVVQNPLESLVAIDPECTFNFWHTRRMVPPMKLPRIYSGKLCKSKDGLVRSIEELKQNESIGDCTEVLIDDEFGTSCRLEHLDLKEFQRGWYKLPRDSKRSLYLSHNSIHGITPELLNDLPSDLSFIDLSFNKIETITNDVIENTYCRELHLESNSLSTIEDRAFQGTNLTFLSVGNNSLDNLAFVRTLSTSIIELDLSHNSFANIPVNTFRGLKNLKVIDLSNNRIENLKTGIFEDQENLSELLLNGNRIGQLNSELFKNLKMLEFLDLESNEIKKISHGTFSFLKNPNLQGLVLTKNQIDTIEEGSFDVNITLLNLSFNRITDESIAKGAFSSSAICYLLLVGNMITKIDDKFDGLSKVYFMNLDGNPMVSVNTSESPKNVRRLRLANSPLKRLVEGGSEWFYEASEHLPRNAEF